MLAERNPPVTEADPVDAAMAWHGNDARATIQALLEDRVRLQEQLAIAKACVSKGFTRGWRPRKRRRSGGESAKDNWSHQKRAGVGIEGSLVGNFPQFYG